jgi:hypothetical protein
MEVVQELRCENVVLEVDNSTLAYALKMPGAGRSMIAGICQDIRELCSGFSSFCVEWIRREANQLADRCAKFPSVDDHECVWTGCLPVWLEEAAAQDLLPSSSE